MKKKRKLIKRQKIIIAIVLIVLIVLIGTVTIILITNRQKTKVLKAQEEKDVSSTQEAKESNILKEKQVKEYTEEHVNKTQDASGDIVPVPKGYVGSKASGENEIDTGYVIYEGEEEVNDTNVADAKKTRNQYVWVPVYDTSKFYGKDSNGKLWGKNYEFSTSTSSNYDQITGTKPLDWSESNGIMTPKEGSFLEPIVLSKNGIYEYDIPSNLKKIRIRSRKYT